MSTDGTSTGEGLEPTMTQPTTVAPPPPSEVIVLSDGTEVPVVASRPRPFAVVVLCAVFAFQAARWFFSFFVAVRMAGLGAGLIILPVAGFFALTALLLLADRVGRWLAIGYAVAVAVSGVIGYLVSLGRVRLSPSSQLHALADGWVLQVAAGLILLVLLTRPQVRRFYDKSSTASLPGQALS